MIKDSPELEEMREKFKIYYHNNLKEKFYEMEIHRKKNLMTFIFLCLGIFFVFPALCVFFFGNLINMENMKKVFMSRNVPTHWVSFVALVITALLYIPIDRLKKKSKNNVMEPLIGFFGNFQYKHGCCSNIKQLKKTKLVGDYNIANVDDYFCGSYKDVEIVISEETLFKTLNAKKLPISRPIKIFQGVIIVLDMNKKFEGQTVVKKNELWPGNKLNDIELERVVLEDIEFEKMFKVFSSDQIEARYLLTTAFMERMIRLRNSYKSKKMEFSFFDNKLVITLHLKKDMFEASSIFKNSNDYKHVEEIFNQLYAIFSIIDILKLNQKAVL